MIWEGPHAVQLGRKTAGATNPLVADIGSIRGDYSTESYEMSDELGRAIHSIVHASGSVEEAEQEIAIWFKPEEAFDYEMIDENVFYGQDWGRVKKQK
jgi:nucleoside-diphosphate kinase